jgi:hypothetical protein
MSCGIRSVVDEAEAVELLWQQKSINARIPAMCDANDASDKLKLTGHALWIMCVTFASKSES